MNTSFKKVPLCYRFILASIYKDYQLTVLADCCADVDEEIPRVLLPKVFPRQAEIVQAATWSAQLANQ